MRETSESEAGIAGLLQSDDPAAQERGATALHRRYSGPLMHYLERRCGLAEADAAEVLNQVLYRAVRRIDTLRDKAKLTGWMYRLAHSAAMDWHRKEARLPPSVSLDDPTVRALAVSEPAPEGTEIEQTPGDAGVDLISRAMQRLSERDRDVLIAVANDLSNDDLAQVFDVTPATARVLRHRAIERLRREAERCRLGEAGKILKEGNR